MKESKEAARRRAAEITELLRQRYPDASCSLDAGEDPWRLLVMARLSAQCTDERVNIVSEGLFAALPTPQAMADAPLEQIEGLIKSWAVPWQGKKHSGCVQNSVRAVRRAGARHHGSPAVPPRRRTQNRQSDFGRRIRQRRYRSGYPLHAHLRTAGILSGRPEKSPADRKSHVRACRDRGAKCILPPTGSVR